MLEVVIGGLIDPPAAKARYTFCAEGAGETGLGFDLTPEGSLAATAVFQRLQNPAPPFAKTQDLASCSAPLCHLFKFVDYSELQLGEGTWRFKAPTVDPVQLVLGLALAFKLDRELEGGWAVEIYSDAWPQFTDLLAMAKALRGTLRIYTSAFDSRVVVADRAAMAVSGVTFEALSLKKEWAGGRLCAVEVPAPAAEAAEDVRELLRVVFEAGGFVTLKYAIETFGNDAVMRAQRLGYVKLDPLTMSLRLTELGMSVLA
ncbi:MAG: hypothetical protein RQ839_11835 [Thermoproteus sp.]|nr:hypothetical protein [Thermoproteus sp.]MDT7883185.1 hypothetical protein [Thermoproteus sp.]